MMPLERQPSMTGFLGALRAERDRKASSGPTLVGGLPEEEEGEEPPKKPQPQPPKKGTPPKN